MNYGKNIARRYYTGYQPSLLDCASIIYKNSIAADDVVHSIKSFVEEFIDIRDYDGLSEWTSSSYPRDRMLEMVLLGFADYGYASVRQLETLCKENIRYMYLMNQLTPCFKTINSFIQKLKEDIHQIFAKLTEFLKE